MRVVALEFFEYTGWSARDAIPVSVGLVQSGVTCNELMSLLENRALNLRRNRLLITSSPREERYGRVAPAVHKLTES